MFKDYKMKKSLKAIFTLSLSFLLFSFISCQDVIFDDIRNEVELDDAEVSGPILSIVRYKDSIYVANGIIYSAPKDTTTNGSWAKLEGIPSGKIYELASDADCLYAAVLTFEDDNDGYNVPDTRYLYKYDGSEWTQLCSVDYSSSYPFIVFGTNTPQESNRHAFFRYGTSVYELSSSLEECTDLSSWTALSDGAYEVANDQDLTGALSATVLGSNVILSAYRSATSNETKDAAATCVYTANSDDVYYSTDGSEWTSVDTDAAAIYSIGYSQDYMLLGTASGIEHVLITDNVPGASTQDFDNNAASALSSYYEVPAVLVIDPSVSEYSTAILATAEFDGTPSSTSASLDNVGLWGYDPSSGEWNRR